MTREEALIQLRIGPGINEDVSAEYDDAVNMAIKSLKQKDILDKIKADIERYNQQAPHYDMISVGLVFQIIDKYKVESEE